MDRVNLALGREHERLAFQEKLRKYQKLERTAERNGWNVTPLYIEVGARGYINNKWCSMSKTVGMTNKEIKALRYQSTTIAQKCSFYIYLSCTNKGAATRSFMTVSLHV